MKGKIYLAIGLVVTLAVTGWFILTQPMFSTHDYLHGARIAEMTRGLQEGQLPVIWSQNFAWGYGMPLFEFYAPLPYFLGALLRLTTMDLVWVTKILFLLSSLLTFAGSYFLAREFYEEKWAMLSGLLASLASYRATDILARGALSEIWAIAALPWLFLGIILIFKREKNGFWLSVMGAVILILSHNITTVLVLGSVILLGLFWQVGCLIKKTKKKEMVAVWQKLLGAVLLAFGLTAFYLLPALMEQDQTQLKTWILSEYFDYNLHFVYPKQFLRNNFGYGGSGYGDNDGLSFFLGYAQLALLAVTGVMLIVKTWQWPKAPKKEKQLLLFGWGGLFVLGFNLWMATYWSAPAWKLFQKLLAFSQFPWRFLGVILIVLALLAPLGCTLIKSKFGQNLCLGLSLCLLVSTSWQYFRGVEVDWIPSDFYNDDIDYIRGYISFGLVDYLPKDFANEWKAVPMVQKIVSGKAPTQIIQDKMTDKIYVFESTQEAVVELALADYPDWQVEINGEQTAVTTSVLGNVTFTIPAGKSVAEIKLQPSPIRRLANTISGVTIGGLIIFLGWQVVKCKVRRSSKKLPIKKKTTKTKKKNVKRKNKN